MKRTLILTFLAFIVVVFTFRGYTQTYTMTNNSPITTCSGTWYDPGGTNNYSNNQQITQTITATSGHLRITFNTFNTESTNLDYLEIYDGNSTNAPLLGRYGGGTLPPQITSTGSSLTFYFRSDGSITRYGWTATLSCYDPAPIPMTSTPISTCNLYYSDPQGTNNYNNNTDIIQTINTGSSIATNLIVSFTQFSLAAGDYLYIHNGNSIAAPLVGSYTGNTIPPTFTSTGTSVTFHFVSNASTVSTGWLANISCQQCITVSTMSGSPCAADNENSTGFAASPFCEDENPYGITFPSETSSSADATTFLGSSAGCLSSVPRPSWYYMQINNPGNLLLYIEQNSIATGNGLDVDFACWGPFTATDQIDFMSKLCCGEYNFHTSSHNSHRPTDGNHTNNTGGYPYGNLIDCSYSAASTEWCYIPNAQIGEFYILLLTNYNGGNANITFNSVAQYSTATTDCELLAQITSNSPLCTGETLQLTCNNNQSAATYAWTGPNGFTSTLQNPIINNVTSANSGVYSMTLTVNGIASSPATTTVVVHNTPNVSLTTSNNPICRGESVSLTASGAGTYQWSNNLGTGTTKNISPNTTTTYFVTGSLSNCTDTTSIEIQVMPRPSVTIGMTNTTICPSIGMIPAYANASQGTPDYEYTWSGIGVVNLNSDSTHIIIDSTSCNQNRNITVNISDLYGCTASYTRNYIIRDNIAPVFNAPFPNQIAETVGSSSYIPNLTTLVQAGTTDNCWQSSRLQVTQNPAAGTPITTNTIVNITVTDPCNNSATTTILVIVPVDVVIITQQDATCFGTNNGLATCSATGGAPPYTFSWNTSPTQTTDSATNLAPGVYIVTVIDALGNSDTGSVTITEPQRLFATADITPNTCNLNNGIIALTIHNGIAPFSYLWNNDITTNSLNHLTAGSYSCTITDQNGCLFDSSFSITNIPLPTLALQVPTSPLCPTDGNQTLNAIFSNAVDPVSFLWSGIGVQNANQNQVVLSIDTTQCNTFIAINVTMTDGNNCIITETDTVVIQDITPPYVNIPITPQNAVINNFQYIIPDVCNLVRNLATDNCWHFSQLQATQSPIAGTVLTETDTVMVTLTDPCNNSVTVPVIIIVPLGLTATITATTNISCYGDNDGSITVNVLGGIPPLSYEWNSTPTQNGTTATQLYAGNYTVTITDANGFSTTSTATLTQPDSLSQTCTSTESTCGLANGTLHIVVNGGVSPYQYAWSNGTTNSTISNLNAGMYSVTVTDANRCSLQHSDSVSAISAPQITIVKNQSENCQEQNGEIIIQVTGGTPEYHYRWSSAPDNDNAIIENLAAGNYSVTITDQDGCTSTKEITIDEFNISASVQNSTPETCELHNGSITIAVSGGSGFYQYDWMGIQDFQENQANNLAAGNYLLIITDSICTLPFHFTISAIPTPVACFELNSGNNIITNMSLQFIDCSTFATQWHWDFGDNYTSNYQNANHFYSESGEYTIVLFASNEYNCTDSVSQTILVNESALIYFPSAFTPNKDGLNDVFKPSCLFISPNNYSMRIYDRWGSEIFHSQDFNEGWDGRINGKPVHTISEFTYLIYYHDLTGKPFKKVGSFTLIP